MIIIFAFLREWECCVNLVRQILEDFVKNAWVVKSSTELSPEWRRFITPALVSVDVHRGEIDATF